MSTSPADGYIKVKNFEKFQHYKDRNPPWIKLYIWLLDDYDFRQLSDDNKWNLVGIFLLASQHENRIPNDPDYISNRIGAHHVIDLQPLMDSKFISLCKQGASRMLADRKQNASPSREEKSREEKSREENITTTAREISVEGIDFKKLRSELLSELDPIQAVKKAAYNVCKLVIPEEDKQARRHVFAKKYTQGIRSYIDRCGGVEVLVDDLISLIGKDIRFPLDYCMERKIDDDACKWEMMARRLEHEREKRSDVGEPIERFLGRDGEEEPSAEQDD